MLKKLLAAALLLSLFLSLASCQPAQSGGTSDGKLKIAVTFDAIYELTLAVVGDRADVYEIVPSGTDVHDFEPSMSALTSLAGAQLVIFNGLGLETWLPGAVKASGNTAIAMVDTSSGVTPRSAGGGYDPHVWLSIPNAEIQVKNIFDAVAKADPANYGAYYKNYTEFIGQLSALYNEYAAKFAAAPRRVLVTGHAAFGYLCQSFSLTQISATGVFDDGEPAARTLVELIQYCQANDIKTVFDESSENHAAMQTLAQQTGAQLVPLYTMELAENGQTYLQRLQYDLAAVYAAMSQ